jgi:hypothetical protein
MIIFLKCINLYKIQISYPRVEKNYFNYNEGEIEDDYNINKEKEEDKFFKFFDLNYKLQIENDPESDYINDNNKEFIKSEYDYDNNYNENNYDNDIDYYKNLDNNFLNYSIIFNKDKYSLLKKINDLDEVI